MKIGRNDPCPCGSGKKYKKCCVDKAAPPSQALYYRRLSEAHNRLMERLMAYATRTFGDEAIDVAMHEFLLWPDSEDEVSEDRLDRAGYLFWPWFVFNWAYDPADDEGALAGPEGRTVAELYAEAHAQPTRCTGKTPDRKHQPPTLQLFGSSAALTRVKG